MVDDHNYFVPVTKYLNSNSDKIKIIIDSLKGNYLSSTNLNGYLTYKSDIKTYQIRKIPIWSTMEQNKNKYEAMKNNSKNCIV